jgi:hypothetical protein
MDGEGSIIDVTSRVVEVQGTPSADVVVAAEDEDGGDGAEVTLFKPSFEQEAFFQKAESAGFLVGLELNKWMRLLALLRERGMGLYHATPAARVAIADVHAKGKDVTLNLKKGSQES